MRRWKVGVASLLLAATSIVIWPFRFSYYSICSECGAIQNTIEWQLPWSRVVLFKYSTVEATPLSSYLTTPGVLAPHTHRWLFGHGGGNGITCAQGDGDLIRGTVTAPEFAQLVELTRQFDDPEQSNRFLRWGFDRDVTRTMRDLAGSIPTNGISSRDQYRAWLSDQSWLIADVREAASHEK
jgi:hypothetical protein